MNFINPSRIIQTTIANAISSAFDLVIEPSKISLEIGYPKYEAHYTSTIALAITNRLNLSPLQIAEAIALTCSQNLEITSQWQIQALGKGWLNIFLSEQYITKSLLALEQSPIEGIINHDGLWQKRDIFMDFSNKSLVPIWQYAYARCCALIRLAYQNNVGIDVVAIHELSLHLSLKLEPAEISLLLQNLAIANYLENETCLDRHQSRTKLSQSLADAFLQFYDRCRIFGVSREIAVRRIFLISITQKLLLAIAPPEINYAMYL